MSEPTGNDIFAASARWRASLGKGVNAELHAGMARPFVGQVHPYVAKALEGVCEHLAGMADGQGRNDYANGQLWRFIGYAAAGHIDEGTVLVELRNAAANSGLGEFELRKLFRSDVTGALAIGRQTPLDPPPRQDRPTTPGQTDPSALLWTPPDVNPSTGELLDPPPDVDPAIALAELEAHRENLVRERLPVLDWHELWNNPAEVEWLLEPLVPARRLVALYSPPKVGKSLLMLEVAAAIATGRTVLGVHEVTPRRVLYVDFENDPDGDVQPRLQAMGYNPDELGGLRYLSFPSLDTLDTANGGAMLLAAAQVHEVDLVVIDTVSRAVGGDENSNDTWLSFYRCTGLPLKRAGIACLRLDHSGKDAEKGMRGGSAKYGDVDAVWRLSTVVADHTYTLECTDNRFPLTEKLLTLHREPAPWLHHRVDPGAKYAAFVAGRDEAVAVLDRLKLPDDVGEVVASRAVREAGETVRRTALRAALTERKARAERLSGLTWTPPPVLDGDGVVTTEPGVS